MATETINLLDLSNQELVQLVVDWGQPRFRAAQIWRWVYHTLTDAPEEMTNLPDTLRQRLAEETTVRLLSQTETIVASDGLASKVLFETADGHHIEAVLMR